jgi:ribonuclease E
VVDGAPPTGPSQQPIQHADLPDRLRVHQLARALGSTNKEVLEALVAIDGRARSVQSGVDREDALRVRDLIFAKPLPNIPGFSSAPVAQQPLLLRSSTEPAEYMPLFVAPQPVQRDERDDGDEDYSGADADDSDIVDDEQTDRPANRRRRRGRRGRGRGRGEQGGPDGQDSGDDDGDAEDADSDDADDSDAGDDENGSSEAATRRRRRRRRRKSGAGDDGDEGPAPDDPPNTVVHERPPRSGKSGDDGSNGAASSEIKGIDGSTRLEAKRQRRRDGRDAGRRRPPVLTEAEFLARREAVERMMVVRDRVRTEPPHPGSRYTQIAVLEDGIVVEHFVTSAASASLVGNIYLGIVQNVLPSMEAAFVDIGRGRNGVLYAGEVNWEAAGLGGSDRKIEQALKPGDYVVVQVSKDPVGHKGARLTTQVSLAGRYLVYVPGASSTGISRKLPDTERQRLKEILREVVPPDAGVIIRTASEGVKEDDIRKDVTRLQERWQQIQAKATETKEKAAGAAVALYEEPDVLVKVIRDLFNEDFAGLIVSGDEAWNTINEYVNSVAPELLSKLTRYAPASEGGPDVFAVHRIDEQLAKAIDRKVWLPSGGTLVIDRTEAMTVIDVNTGKFTGSGGNLEQTVTKNNLEAAEEIVRQLRLRDIGGIVVIDFIDMVLESNRDLVLRRLTEALARDRTRHQVSEVTSLGLVQLTRKRLGTGLIEAFSTSCPNCGGRGILLHADPVDSAPTNGRKSESGGRRGRRSKKGRSEEPADQPAVAKVPAHAPGEHPMFKAMAAGTTGAAGAGDEDDQESEEAGEEVAAAEEAAEQPAALQDTDQDDFEDTDEDTDEGEDDLDDEDLDDEDLDDDDEDLDLDDDDLDDGDPDDDENGDDDANSAVGADGGAPFGRPRRRRAAGRPAGPPIHAD